MPACNTKVEGKESGVPHPVVISEGEFELVMGFRAKVTHKATCTLFVSNKHLTVPLLRISQTVEMGV